MAALKLASILSAVLLASCQQGAPAPADPTDSPAAVLTAPPAPEPPAVPAPPLPPAPELADQWLGKWIGPEGTFLELARNGDAYSVTIQSLDGPASYQGKAALDRLEFMRDGKLESIHASSGAETGMKWLLEKKSCLTIKTGEGFCRD